MKILKKALISLSIILLNTTRTYATTTGTYVPESDSGIGKFLLFLIAIGLVALVLFIGYKLDKNEVQEKRKEKILKQRDDDVYSNVYSSYNKEEKEEVVEELPEISFAPKTEEYFKNTENESTQKLDIVNEENTNSYDGTSSVEEKVIYEEVEEDGYTEEEDVYQSEDFGETQVISVEENEYENANMDSTMVFNTNPINNLDINMDVEEKIINKISDIKEYDYEDNDMDLLDLEQTIAEANIKKYTRDKNQEMIKVKRVPKKKEETKENKKQNKEENKTEKKYTRKKVEKKETPSKRYKAKKTTTKKEKSEKENKVEKKYTRKKAETKEITKEEKKTKGRKSTTKKETEEKPKRGRKPSVKK